jgi:hypothetical protein
MLMAIAFHRLSNAWLWCPAQVRKAFVSAMRATAEAARMSSTNGGGPRVSYLGGDPSPVLAGASEADMVGQKHALTLGLEGAGSGEGW